MERDVNDRIHKLVKSKKDVEYLLRVHKNLVYWCLGKYKLLNSADHECESAAWEALWDAINTFDVFSKGQFSSYAVRCILNRIGDVLRKRKHIGNKVTFMPVDLEVEDTASTVDAACEARDLLKRVQAIFDEYINLKTGTSRNILLVWQAANFDIDAKMIASICGTTSATVGKTLTAFRAYLHTRLRD